MKDDPHIRKNARNARLIDSESSREVVDFGATVKLKDLESCEELQFTIVGSAESDPLDNKISNESPVGRAIFGSPVGAIIEVKVPAGVMRYQILEIK